MPAYTQKSKEQNSVLSKTTMEAESIIRNLKIKNFQSLLLVTNFGRWGCIGCIPRGLFYFLGLGHMTSKTDGKRITLTIIE